MISKPVDFGVSQSMMYSNSKVMRSLQMVYSWLL